MGCLVDINFINQEIDSLGESVIVRVVTKSSFSKWGDATESVADTSSVKCFMNFMTQDDDEVKEGVFKAGDIRFWFKGTQSINRGDRIRYDNKWYEVEELIPIVLAGTTLIKDVRVSKAILPPVKKSLTEETTLSDEVTPVKT